MATTRQWQVIIMAAAWPCHRNSVATAGQHRGSGCLVATLRLLLGNIVAVVATAWQLLLGNIVAVVAWYHRGSSCCLVTSWLLLLGDNMVAVVVA